LRRSARLAQKRDECPVGRPSSELSSQTKKRRSEGLKEGRERVDDFVKTGRGRGRKSRVQFSPCIDVGQEVMDDQRTDAGVDNVEASQHQHERLDRGRSRGRGGRGGRGGRSGDQPRKDRGKRVSRSSGRDTSVKTAADPKDASSSSRPVREGARARGIGERLWKAGRQSAQARLAEQQRSGSRRDGALAGSSGVMALSGQKQHDYD